MNNRWTEVALVELFLNVPISFVLLTFFTNDCAIGFYAHSSQFRKYSQTYSNFYGNVTLFDPKWFTRWRPHKWEETFGRIVSSLEYLLEYIHNEFTYLPNFLGFALSVDSRKNLQFVYVQLENPNNSFLSQIFSWKSHLSSHSANTLILRTTCIGIFGITNVQALFSHIKVLKYHNTSINHQDIPRRAGKKNLLYSSQT